MSALFDRLYSDIERLPPVEGIPILDLLDLRPQLHHVINMIMRRRGMSLKELLSELNLEPAEVGTLMNTLVEKGYLKAVETEGETRYQPLLARKRRRETKLDVWETLDK